LRPRQRGRKGMSQKEVQESHHILPGVWECVRDWTLTLPRQLPLWEMESRWTPKTSENYLKGQNSMACDVFYIIRKLLECKCLKWARIAHLDIWNTSYSQKKGRESNCQFDFWPQKVRNWPDLLGYRWCATYCWKKLSTRATTLLQIAPPSEVYSQSYGAPKSWESQLARFRDSHSGVPGKKSHLDVGSVANHKV
jgi:hypothetical protein